LSSRRRHSRFSRDWSSDVCSSDLDRSKDIIISGGENVSSVEVEDILYKHPAVLFAAVVAKPDPKWGEVPCAFIELKDGAKATERSEERRGGEEARGRGGTGEGGAT